MFAVLINGFHLKSVIGNLTSKIKSSNLLSDLNLVIRNTKWVYRRATSIFTKMEDIFA